MHRRDAITLADMLHANVTLHKLVRYICRIAVYVGPTVNCQPVFPPEKLVEQKNHVEADVSRQRTYKIKKNRKKGASCKHGVRHKIES